MIRSVVVLPAPFGPSRPKIAPRLPENVRSSTARVARDREPKVLTRFFTTIAGFDTDGSLSVNTDATNRSDGHTRRRSRSGKENGPRGGQRREAFMAIVQSHYGSTSRRGQITSRQREPRPGGRWRRFAPRRVRLAGPGD